MLASREDVMTERTMRRKGYQIKHSVVGWWVDGACGYKVAVYFDTKEEAISEASKEIERAKKEISKSIFNQPAWYLE
jgi:Ser-tRNA(Ala) deacylase AlaX